MRYNFGPGLACSLIHENRVWRIPHSFLEIEDTKHGRGADHYYEHAVADTVAELGDAAADAAETVDPKGFRAKDILLAIRADIPQRKPFIFSNNL